MSWQKQCRHGDNPSVCLLCRTSTIKDSRAVAGITIDACIWLQSLSLSALLAMHAALPSQVDGPHI